MINKNVELINNKIKDDILKDILFNYNVDDPTFLTKNAEYIDYFYNMMIVSAAIIYKKFIKWKNTIDYYRYESLMQEMQNSSLRIYNLLNQLYINKNFDINFVESLMTNIQIDFATNYQKNFLTSIGLDEFIKINPKVSKYFHWFTQSKLSSKSEVQFDFDQFYDIVKSFKYFNDVKMEIIPYCTNTKLKTINVIFEDEVLSLDDVIVIKGDDIYTLESYSVDDPKTFEKNNNKQQVLHLKYISLDLSRNLILHISDIDFLPNNTLNDELYIVEDLFLERFFDGYNILQNKKKENDIHFLRNFTDFDNKYIKGLSIIISDVLTAKSKQKILIDFSKKYSQVFDRLKLKKSTNLNVNNYNWDEMVLFLMMQEGISVFLNYLFSKNVVSVESVISQLKISNGDRAIKLIDEFEFSRQLSNYSIEVIVRNIINIATKLFSIDRVYYESNNKHKSIVDIIIWMNVLNKNCNNYPIAFSKLTMRLLQVLSFLCIFYDSLSNYTQLKSIWDMKLKEGWEPTYSEFKAKNKENLSVFSTSIANNKEKYAKYVELNKQNINYDYVLNSIGFIQDAFKDFNKINDEISSRENPKNIAFSTVIGKKEIFDRMTMKHHEDEIVNAYKEISKKKSIKFSKETISRIYRPIYDFFTYIGGFIDGERDFENVIYPISATYSNGVITEDGYRYSYFNISKNIEKELIKVKVIIDGDYNFGEYYYCLPNVDKTMKIIINEEPENTWFAPVMIPYENYDKDHYYDDTQPVISILSDKNDYQKAASLIYDSEEIAYSNLFGNKENAIKVLSKLFDNEYSNFYKNNYYISKVGDEIVAILSLYRELRKWNTDSINKAFRQCGIEPPDTMKNAITSFADTFDDSISDMYMISDVSVSQEYKRKGHATYLIQYVNNIAKSEGRNTFLTVYNDNYKAIKLYTDLGFVRYVTDFDNRGEGEELNKKYYRMVMYNVV